MTQREFAEISEADYRIMADEIAQKITIRSYNANGTKDETRPTTKTERQIIKELAVAAMLAYGYRNEESGGSLDSILDVTEFALRRFIPEANTYDTIYIPLKKKMGLW